MSQKERRFPAALNEELKKSRIARIAQITKARKDQRDVTHGVP
jgi:hypothetical protein